MDPGSAPQGAGAVSHPRAVAVLVLGICGITIMPFLGPVAWALGRTTLREIDEAPTRYSNRGMAEAGMVLGIVSTVLLILGIVLFATIIIWVTTGDGIKNYEMETLLAALVHPR